MFSPSAPADPTLSEALLLPPPPLALNPFAEALLEVVIYMEFTIPAPSLELDESIKA